LLVVNPTSFRHLASTDSTNSECARLIKAGQLKPIWVLADQQSHGRGRLNRKWSSSVGNLYASGLYRFEQNPEQLAQLGFAAALAVIDVLSKHMPAEALRLKWPNDVLADGAKIAGILLECLPQADGAHFIVIGIGINVAHAPQLIDRETACLAQYRKSMDRQLSPPDIMPDLIQSFEKWVKLWKSDGFAPLRNSWVASAYGLGNRIVTSNRIEGRFEDMSETGALILRKNSGQVIKISAGEVYFSQ